MGEDDSFMDKKKPHKSKHSGVKAEKKKGKKQLPTDRQKNPKGFAITSARSAELRFRRKQDLQTKKHHIPLVDATPEEPPPIVIAVVGPPKVGKSTLINNLIKNFTRTNVTNINGPISIVVSKKRRLTIIECNNDINAMIDIAKCADLVLLMCDASFGFEMEIFEFLNICQVHGMPKIMGVLTHLDAIKNTKALQKKKKLLKHRFWTEVYQGAKLFYLSGIQHGEYLRNEIKNLGRFIHVMKFRPLTWRGQHSYILADRVEDITNQEEIRLNPKCDRNVVLYGYVRGIPLKKNSTVHIAGYGDIKIDELEALSDPCPMPSREKKRNLLEKERLLYAPMSGVGGIVYDKDAVYIELQGSHSHHGRENEQSKLVKEIINKKETFDEQIQNQEFRLFSDGDVIKSMDFQDDDDDDEEVESENEGSDDSGMDSEPEMPEMNDGSGWKPDEDDEELQDEDNSSDEEYQNLENDPDDLIHMSWKEGVADRARDAYLDRQSNNQNLMKLVYGKAKTDQETTNEDDDEIGGLFKNVTKHQTQLHHEKQQRDAIECPFFENYGEGVRNWTSEENKKMLVNCFVTGKWKSSEDAEKLLALDDMSDGDSEVYGDFEDLETGEKFTGKEQEDDEDVEEAPKIDESKKKRKYEKDEEANLTRAELMAKKLKLKEKFDAEYDNPELKDSHRIDGEESFYEALKAEADKQAELNRKEFAELDENVRLEIEGFRAGLYVRMSFKDLPCEFIENFDPTYPILIGALNMAEENIGLISCKVKKHRWYRKVLKTNDPLIISLGWRRFQTVPMFAKIEDDLKHRFLKYTPNHVTCNMSFYGPITPQNTGFLAIQTVSSDIKEMKRIGFRIAATGAVNEVDKTSQIMKKLKLVGTPHKIFKKTAFISGMFNSALEVAKFEGAKIKTVSGIRGQIKKAEREPPGSFRATFEDKIQISDIVFCRTWFKVDVPQFYVPITNLLLPIDAKSQWQGMKTHGQLKREKNIKAEVNEDHLYKPIERQAPSFRPLIIPASLQRSLPYKDKPKNASKDPKQKFEATRVAVIHSPHEQKITKMMKMLKANHQAKEEKRKASLNAKFGEKLKLKEKEDLRNLQRQKELKKKVFRALSKIQSKEEKGEKSGGKKKFQKKNRGKKIGDE
ncbi:CLUMA_CG019550, isoform A [Clunio marinus]|uniref:CLUMA_CG019550, isoform A n=1 Tax=Clunio marinus TaxID=568069 RepID=A0A1J1J4X9_9DIPT|nr:CLUMA_CG019550, isoform A [Clunio marinus]